MATIEEFKNSMTIIYFKSDGKINEIFGGIQDFNVLYGDRAMDFSQILDSKVFPRNDYVMQNKDNFRVNAQTLELEILPNAIPKYPIAAQ